MTIPVRDRLYELLPALYRIRDSEPNQAEALRALMALIEQQFLALEVDIGQLYDDAFIETCQEWIVPYIGDLLGVRPLQGTGGTYSQRAYVANTLAYRQRKGTATVLEQLARDVTQWPARVVEYFERLEWTQYSNHLRLQSWRTPDLRDTHALELLNSPFETAQHTPEIRHIDNGRGRYNIPHLGLGLWRLQAYPLIQVQARPVPGAPGLFWVNPLGQNLALFNDATPETEITTLAQEINVPTPLRRRPLYEEVEALAENRLPATTYFNHQPVLEVFLDGAPGSAAIAATDLLICDLSGEPGAADSNWQQPNIAHLLEREANPHRQVAIDPVLGRLAIPVDVPIPEAIWVSYAYGFSGDVGGGPYDRRDSVAQALSRSITWQVGVSREVAAVGDEIIVTDLAAAIALWHDQPVGTIGAIVLMDNHTYESGSDTDNPIALPAGSELLIVAADWPLVALPPSLGGEVRNQGQFVPIQRRPHLLGDLFVRGTAPADSPNPGRLILDGLLIEGRLTIQAGNLEGLRLAHSTLVPDRGGLVGQPGSTVGETNNRLTVEIDHSITGPIYLPSTLAALNLNDSIVDGSEAGRVWLTPPLTLPFAAGNLRVEFADGSAATLAISEGADLDTVQANLQTALQGLPELAEAQVGQADDRLLVVSPLPLTFTATATDSDTIDRLGLQISPAAIAAPNTDQAAPVTTMQRTTLFGSSYMQALQLGSEVIWTDIAIAQRRQIGCVRFSYVPPGSQTPRRYRCQPDLEIEIRLELAQKQKGDTLTASAEGRLRRRTQRQIVPSFTSRRYGDAAYAQLGQTCPAQIRTGADDGSEMGVFSFLKQPQREANLRTVLDEYLRFGLEAGIFYLT